MEKQKRIKRVFSSADQVIHLWANESQSDARSAHVFFEGRDLYSYGRHYLLGRIIQFNGKKVFLVNNHRYSVTTSKHISWTWNAVENRIRLYTDDVSGDPKTIVRASLLDAQDGLINECFNHFNSRRFWSGYRFNDDAWSLGAKIKEFNETCDALGFKNLKLDVNDDYLKLYSDHVKACIKKREIENALKNDPEYIAKKQAEKLKKLATDIEKWRAGGFTTESIRSLHPMILRIKGDMVETSRGAGVPVDHALRLLRKIKNGSVKPGDKIGAFSFTSLSKNSPNTHDGGETVVKIGCHTILLSEALEVLKNQKANLEIVGG